MIHRALNEENGMKIKNKQLENREKNWIENLLCDSFLYRDEILKQIENSEIEREYTDYFISVKFKVNKSIKPIELNSRVPVELRVYREDHAPMQFLLHVINGYVNELEVFYADSSKINRAFEIWITDKKEILLDEKVKITAGNNR